MNLPAYFKGVIKALKGAPDWAGHFDLSRRGFQLSFLALFISIPFYHLCAVAVQARRSELTGEAAGLPANAFLLILLLYGLMFPLCAYILALVFDRQDRFKSWVIVRHWAFFFAVGAAGLLFGLNLLGVLPFGPVNYIAFAIYLGTLLIDIRLAQKIAGFDWGAAILTACIITAMSLMMLLVGVSQFV